MFRHGATRPLRTTRRVYFLLAMAIVLAPLVAPATIEEQRARLPPPATCDDPVEGVWRSHQYNARFGDWGVFTLTVRRSAPGANTLVGTIHSHSWSGGPAQSEPPRCSPGIRHWTVQMSAAGTWDPSRRAIEFWGTRWWIESIQCERWATYNLDHFSGLIDPAIQEFQSVNNDGGRSVNEPRVFRRIQCLGDLSAPHPSVAPPPFRPPSRSGCARR
jgi:hypothetical protein